MAIALPKLQPFLLKELPYEVQEWIRQLQNLAGSGVGSVTSVTVTTANGVSASVATPTTTPTLTFTLGAITPTTIVASSTISGSNLSGTNTGDVNDATITTTDVTTNNVSTTKHGWAPKAPNDATKYLDGTGAYTVPAGSGGGSWTLGSPTATTSGTSIDFTGIPSTVRYIIINLVGVSLNAVNQLRIQTGDSGGIETSGYVGSQSFLGASTVCTVLGGAGFDGPSGYLAADLYTGQIHLCMENSSSNTWTCMGALASTGTSINNIIINGSKSTSAALDRVRITTVGGATFDAGEINIMYL